MQYETPQEYINLTYRYNRAFGFSGCDWANLKEKSTRRAQQFTRQYCDKIEKDSRFRDVTTKKIEKVLLALSIVIILLVLVIGGDILVGAICLAIVLSIVYFLSISKGIKLKNLRREYGLKLEGSDFNYFGITMSNIFGAHHFLVYCLVPFISASVILELKVHVCHPLIKIERC